MNKILIVDDQEQNLYLLKTLLGGYGYQVLEASNGAEALELARANAPDVVISDILMPVMDGFSLCLEWKKDEELRNIPFVFYTATYTDPKDEELALSLGAARFIVKPVEIEEFISILEQVIAEVESGILAVPQTSFQEEMTYYRMYNETLIRKLEDKMLELEKVNRALQEDIIQREQAEEKLRASERKFSVLFEKSSFTAALARLPNGIMVDVNEAFEKAFGYTKQEAIGRTSLELGINPDAEGRARVLAGLEEQGSAHNLELVLHTKTGEARIHTVNVDLVDIGDEKYILSTTQDITERKQMEEALRENESRLQSIIDAEPECVKVLDLNGCLLEMNPAGLAMIEADSLDDVIGQEIANLVVPEHRTAFRDLTHLVSDGRTGTLIFEIEGLKGTNRWLETHAVPLRDNMGTVTAILGITLDVTERKRADELIQRQIQHLRALHTIDSAISSSFDLRMTLGVLLREVISRLGVDAADVLLFNELTQVLEYASARGFHSDAVQHTQLRLGEGFAGRAIVERRIIHIPNIMEAGGNLMKSLLLAGESFVTYFGVPLIAKGQVVGVLEIFHRTLLKTNQEWLDFLEALAKQAAIAIDNAELLQNLQRSNTELIVAYDATLEGWSRAMDLRDRETEGHTQRVTEMAVYLAQSMGIKELELIDIRRGGMLHDIGKLGVPDSILLKPDKLTDDEWEVMRLHPKLAYEMLSPITYLKSALNIPYYHHEKWDGTGYPQGLRGEQISLAARIFAVVDVWDALTNDRPYRPAWTKEQALEYIKEQSGKHFDPQVVRAFLTLITRDNLMT